MAAVQSERTQLFFKLCSDHLSIEAIPRKPIRIDFRKMKSHAISDHELMMWTPHVVVLRNRSGQEITLRRDGRMVIRKAATELIAETVAMEIMNLVLSDFST